jgi:antirestriction protein ArdC
MSHDCVTPESWEDHATEVGHWLLLLENDKRAIFTAATHEQRAAGGGRRTISWVCS